MPYAAFTAYRNRILLIFTRLRVDNCHWSLHISLRDMLSSLFIHLLFKIEITSADYGKDLKIKLDPAKSNNNHHNIYHSGKILTE